MRTVGIDLAATAEGTAVVAVDWTTTATGAAGRASLVHDAATGSADTNAILDALEDGAKIGIDCPFGWPSAFIAAVTAHAVRAPWSAGTEPGDRRELRLWATDRHVSEQQGLNPLSVSSDRIESVAMRCAALLDRHERDRGHGLVDRAGRGRLVEVYPALAMTCWNLNDEATAGYKKGDEQGLLARRELLRRRVDQGDHNDGESGLVLDDALRGASEHPRHGDDVIDALLVALVAAAACTPGGAEAPPPAESPLGALAALEGWIAVPTVPLGRVAPTASEAGRVSSRGLWE